MTIGNDDSNRTVKQRQGERNVGASLQQKLRNHAKAAGEDVALVLIRYVNERFLYRLSVSPYRSMFILRGATLFTVWNAEPHRATRDIDLLATGDASPAALREILSTVCSLFAPEDGMIFLPKSLRIEERIVGRAYQGAHVEIMATLGTAKPRLEIDIAFGEAVVPPAIDVDVPVLMGMPSPRIRAYQRETAIAEKCEAIVKLGIPNTRMKGFYDVWYLCHTYAFDGETLSAALRATFARRNTPFPPDGLPEALSAAFINDVNKQRQWQGFVGKTNLTKEADKLPQLISSIRSFLQPPLDALAQGEQFDKHWSGDGSWLEPVTRTTV